MQSTKQQASDADTRWSELSDAEGLVIDLRQFLMGMGGLLSLLVRSEAANEEWAVKTRRFLETCKADGAALLASECPHNFTWDEVPKAQDQRSIEVAALSLYNNAYNELDRLMECISRMQDREKQARPARASNHLTAL